MDITIRPEAPHEHRTVEELIRDAFWNLYVPGCDEHYLAHIMRPHPDFCHDLNFVAEVNGTIAGSIMYTRSRLIGTGAERLETVTFGPLSVLPAYQRKGIGSALIRHTLPLVKAAGYHAVIIYGNPSNYVSSGFIGSSSFGIGSPEGAFPTALLVLPLSDTLRSSRGWKFYQSSVFEYSKTDAEEYDTQFPPMEKRHQPSQEVFAILSRSFVQ